MVYISKAQKLTFCQILYFSLGIWAPNVEKKTLKKRLGNISGDILKSVHFCYISKATWKYKIYFQVEKMFTNFEKNQ